MLRLRVRLRVRLRLRVRVRVRVRALVPQHLRCHRCAGRTVRGAWEQAALCRWYVPNAGGWCK
jgi:hypothetical protein